MAPTIRQHAGRMKWRTAGKAGRSRYSCSGKMFVFQGPIKGQSEPADKGGGTR